MAGQSRDNALDHVVVVVFENRSLDNVLGRLYGPGDGKTFEGVLGRTSATRSRSGPSTAPAAR
jgi:phospholipase C